MAKIPFGMAVAVGVQSAQGLANINTTVRDASAITEANGALLGDPTAGIGETGIDLGLSRDFDEAGLVSGSFTTLKSIFNKEAISSLSIAMSLKGSGTASPALDADFRPSGDGLGPDALLQGILASQAWGGGTGWQYVPGALTYLTVKLWLGSGSDAMNWVFYDCLASGEFAWTAKEKGILTGTLEVGGVQGFTQEAFPGTVDYGNQSTLTPPKAQGVGNAWGATRGWSELTLNVSNELEQVPDSNASTGEVPLQTDRSINGEVTIYADSSDEDFERAQLVNTGAISDALTFAVGSPPSDPANAYTINVPEPEIREVAPVKLGGQLAFQVTFEATHDTANSELDIHFH